MDTAPRPAAATSLAVGCAVVVVLLEVVAGLAGGSVAVLAAAVHAGVILVAAVATHVAVSGAPRAAAAPPGAGHERLLHVAGTLEALLICLAAAWIVYEAVKLVLRPEPVGAVGGALSVMLLAAATNLLVARRLLRVGRAAGLGAVERSARRLRGDVLVAAGVAVALALIALGRVLRPVGGFEVLDPVAAMAVALLTLKAAWELLRAPIAG